MQPLRALILRRPAFWAVALMATLLVRALVPAGWMPDASRGTITLKLCSGTMLTMPDTAGVGAAMHHGDDGGAGHKAEQPCAFAGLGLSFLGAVPPVLLAAALAFVLSLAFLARPVRPLAAPTRLRPPLRAPPLRV